MKARPARERFWPKVNKAGPTMPGMTTPCWEWAASRDRHGYGTIGVGGVGNGNARAHRVSWEVHFGPVPDGLHVLHHCDNRSCVNPTHLFLGTHADNMADMVSKGRVRGEQNGNSQLTEGQVLEIRALYASATAQEVACRFGISKSTVYAIVYRQKWAHLDAHAQAERCA